MRARAARAPCGGGRRRRARLRRDLGRAAAALCGGAGGAAAAACFRLLRCSRSSRRRSRSTGRPSSEPQLASAAAATCARRYSRISPYRASCGLGFLMQPSALHCASVSRYSSRAFVFVISWYRPPSALSARWQSKHAFTPKASKNLGAAAAVRQFSHACSDVAGAPIVGGGAKFDGAAPPRRSSSASAWRRAAPRSRRRPRRKRGLGRKLLMLLPCLDRVVVSASSMSLIAHRSASRPSPRHSKAGERALDVQNRSASAPRSVRSAATSAKVGVGMPRPSPRRRGAGAGAARARGAVGARPLRRPRPAAAVRRRLLR